MDLGCVSTWFGVHRPRRRDGLAGHGLHYLYMYCMHVCVVCICMCVCGLTLTLTLIYLKPYQGPSLVTGSITCKYVFVCMCVCMNVCVCACVWVSMYVCIV